MRYLASFMPTALAITIAFPLWSADLVTAGLPNFHKVSEKLYRGGQPVGDGWQSLSKLGVKTVVDLRRPNEHDTSEEERIVKALGMRYVNVPMNGIVAPTEEQVLKVLALINSAESGPVFIHCRRGADRTGTIFACYRMGHDGWNNKKAFKEAKSLGMSWMEVGMKRYIMAYKAPAGEVAASSKTAVPQQAAQAAPALP